VVDNASRDGTTAAVRRDYPRVSVLRLRRNRRAAARNAGVRRCPPRSRTAELATTVPRDATSVAAFAAAPPAHA
jgi:Glycosyl transferase family 2